MGQAMFTIFKDFSFSAAHAIRGHTRGCQNLHGHNYRVRVHLRAERLEIVTDESNVASRRVAEKCGFRTEGRMRDAWVVDGAHTADPA